MASLLISIAVFLNLTGLFSFAAASLGVPVAVVSIVLLALMSCYILLNYKLALQLARHPVFLLWVVAFLFLPFATRAAGGGFVVSSFGLHVYLLVTMLSTAVAVSQLGADRFAPIVDSALIVALLGLFLSLIAPEFFAGVASIVNGHSSFQGRAFGFYMQPNIAATNFTLLVLLWMYVSKWPAAIPKSMLWLLLVVGVAVTGSRGGLVVALGVIVVILFESLYRSGGARALSTAFGLLVVGAVVSAAFVLFAPALMNLDGAQTAKFGLVDRLISLTELDFSELDNDESLGARLLAQAAFIERIIQNPVFGHGVGMSNVFVQNGLMKLNSHNEYIRTAFESGVIGLLLTMSALLCHWYQCARKRLSILMGVNPMLHVVALLFVTGFLSNTLLDSRVLFVLLGVLLAFVRYPGLALKNESLITRIASPAGTASS